MRPEKGEPAKTLETAGLCVGSNSKCGNEDSAVLQSNLLQRLSRPAAHSLLWASDGCGTSRGSWVPGWHQDKCRAQRPLGIGPGDEVARRRKVLGMCILYILSHLDVKVEGQGSPWD